MVCSVMAFCGGVGGIAGEEDVEFEDVPCERDVDEWPVEDGWWGWS